MIAKLRISLFTFAAMGLAPIAFYEVGLAYPVSWWLYLATGTAFALALWPFAPGRFQRVRIFTLLAISVAIAALYFVPWTSRKPFLRNLAKVDVGMTEARVHHIMRGYLVGTGLPVCPFDGPTKITTLSIVGSSSQYSTATSPDGQMTLRETIVFRHSAYSSDWGIVSLSDGRVSKVEFSPD